MHYIHTVSSADTSTLIIKTHAAVKFREWNKKQLQNRRAMRCQTYCLNDEVVLLDVHSLVVLSLCSVLQS